MLECSNWWVLMNQRTHFVNLSFVGGERKNSNTMSKKVAVITGAGSGIERKNSNTMSKKVAVITGAGSGIGLAVAQRLSVGGWTVVLSGRTASKLDEAAKSLKGDGHLCVVADVSVDSDVEHLFRTVEKTYGRLDLLFNNAGINCSFSSFEDVSPEDFKKVISTNVIGVFLCSVAAIKIMKKNGGGRIVNNGSISAHVPRPGSAPYTASKHAVSALTKCLALDGRASNVACGQIDYGNVVTELSAAMNKAGSGAMQANGALLEEPTMTLEDAAGEFIVILDGGAVLSCVMFHDILYAHRLTRFCIVKIAETFWTMANLPLSANVLNMTVMATKMPFVGRG